MGWKEGRNRYFEKSLTINKRDGDTLGRGLKAERERPQGEHFLFQSPPSLHTSHRKISGEKKKIWKDLLLSLTLAKKEINVVSVGGFEAFPLPFPSPSPCLAPICIYLKKHFLVAKKKERDFFFLKENSSSSTT